MPNTKATSPFPKNVVNSIGAPLNLNAGSVFLTRLFDALRISLGDQFEQYTFVLHQWAFGQFAGACIPLDPGGPDRVLIIVGDEKEVFPVENFLSYRAIFRSYGNPSRELSNVHAFPVGYFDAAGTEETVPFNERTHSFFFSGYLNRNRVDLYKQFRTISWLPKRNLKNRLIKELARRAVEKLCPERNFNDVFPGARVGFTEWFGKGLDPAVYARTLASSKIALCPAGFVSSETIRHWEAMRLGCVVISTPLPPNRYYKNSPIIELQDWSELKPTLSRLLADPDELRARHEATVDWWNRVCSEQAVAEYLADEIRRLKSNS